MLEITRKYREQIKKMEIALNFYNDIKKISNFIEDIQEVEEPEVLKSGWLEIISNKETNIKKRRVVKCF